jgi:hypothetical protein
VQDCAVVSRDLPGKPKREQRRVVELNRLRIELYGYAIAAPPWKAGLNQAITRSIVLPHPMHHRNARIAKKTLESTAYNARARELQFDQLVQDRDSLFSVVS